jgi:hypothetical protein
LRRTSRHHIVEDSNYLINSENGYDLILGWWLLATRLRLQVLRRKNLQENDSIRFTNICP